MRCCKCSNHILQKSGRRIRLRIKGQVIFEDGLCKAKCYWCGEQVIIPLEIAGGTKIPSEKFILSQVNN